jgi:glycosyltransferase involved in cell wall biosynthesis
MKLCNILFLAIKESEYDFLRYRHDIDSTVFTSFSKDTEIKHLKLHLREFTPKNYQANEYFFKGKNSFFYFPRSLYLFIKREKPDVVMIHGFFFPFQLLCLKFYLPKSTKIIVQHHAEKPFTNLIKLAFQKLAYSNVDAYLFSSRELAQAHLDKQTIRAEEKIHEVMEGSSAFYKKQKEPARKKLNITEETVFLWVGRLDENKDPFTVLKAFHNYKNTASSFKLYMIYGSSDLEQELKTFINTHNLSSCISLVGKIPHLELEDWYSAADYFISASYCESGGVALCEAIACGCIPIATKIPAFIKMTEHGKYGFLFEPGNVKDLEEKLNFLEDVDKNELSEKVRQQFEKEFSLQAIGKKIEKIALSLLQE